MDTWNQRLAHALSRSEFTKNSLASRLGIAAPTVSAWLGSGSITPARDIKGDNLLKVCELLKVRPEWVMFGKLPMERDMCAWPFEGIAKEEYEVLPQQEQARITRFMRDTIDTWRGMQPPEARLA